MLCKKFCNWSIEKAETAFSVSEVVVIVIGAGAGRRFIVAGFIVTSAVVTGEFDNELRLLSGRELRCPLSAEIVSGPAGREKCLGFNAESDGSVGIDGIRTGGADFGRF